MTRLLIGDTRTRLRDLPEASVQCCVTSPPYYGLRDYGVAGQIGLEATPDAYVTALVEVFRDVRRVLKNDGMLWLNLGDSYAASGRGGGGGSFQHSDVGTKVSKQNSRRAPVAGFKPKDLIGIPWRVAFALQAEGWYLRQDIIWAKPNPMPESVTDRCTKAHEYVFLLTKSARYAYHAKAIEELGVIPAGTKAAKGSVERAAQPGVNSRPPEYKIYSGTRNRRSVWTIQTDAYPGAHFAVMPRQLAELCILAGSQPGDTVLDPFAGVGTTLLMAAKHGRDGIGIELNPAYAAQAQARLTEAAGMFAAVEVA